MLFFIEKLENDKNEYLLKVTMEAEKFADEMQKNYGRMKKSVSIPGFRKGKVPFKIAAQYYGPEALLDRETEDKLLSTMINEALAHFYKEDGHLFPTAPAHLAIEKLSLDDGFEISFEMAKYPEFKAEDYKGVTAYCPPCDVSEEEVDGVIEKMRKDMGRLVELSADEEIKDEDHVTVSYKGFLDGEAFEGGSAEDQVIVIGQGGYIPGFEEALKGHKTGDEFKKEITFPEEYHSEKLAGKKSEFEFKITGVKRPEYPELDDDFAMDVSEEADNMQELRDEVRDNLRESKEEKSEREFLFRAVNEASKNLELDFSEHIINDLSEKLLESLDMRLQNMLGINLHDYMHFQDLSFEELLAEQRENALAEAKRMALLLQVARQENLIPGEQEIDDEIEDLDQFKELDEDSDEYKRLAIILDGRVRPATKLQLMAQMAESFIGDYAAKTDEKPEDELDESEEDDEEPEEVEEADEGEKSEESAGEESASEESAE